MPDIAQQLHQHQPNLWTMATDTLLCDSCGIRVPFMGLSYSVTPYEQLNADIMCHSLCYVSEGAARLQIEEETFQVSTGDVILFPKGKRYAIYADPECPWEWCWIIMGGEPIDHIVQENGWLAHPCPLMTNTELPFLAITKAMMQYCRLLPSGSLIVGGLLLQLLGHLTKTERTLEIVLPHADHDQQVTEIISYMGRHLTATVTLEGLAAQFCLSPSQLGKLFRRVTGISPIQYFKYLRIETAKGLLRSTQSIHHIAAQIGFDDVVTFDRAFKRFTGMTPRQYRRQLNG